MVSRTQDYAVSRFFFRYKIKKGLSGFKSLPFPEKIRIKKDKLSTTINIDKEKPKIVIYIRIWYLHWNAIIFC
jgi:hypothetical protein